MKTKALANKDKDMLRKEKIANGKMNKNQQKKADNNKYIESNGRHDVNEMIVTDVAMMSVFNTENKKMERIKKLGAIF